SGASDADGIRDHGGCGGRGATIGEAGGIVRGVVIRSRDRGGGAAAVRRSGRPPVRRRGGRHRPGFGGPVLERARAARGGASMTLVLDPRHVAAIRRHGEADYPAEACGLIGGALEGDRKVVVQLVPLMNQRIDSARNRYLIDPEPFRRAQGSLKRDGLDATGGNLSTPATPPPPPAFDPNPPCPGRPK